MLLLAFAAEGQSWAGLDSLAPLSDFGAEGSRVSDISRQLLDDDFFTQDQTGAFSSGQNYTAFLDLPNGALVESLDLGRGLMRRQRVGELKLGIYLSNLADAPNDITISGVRRGSSTAYNVLVRVEPGETLGLAADELAGFDTVRFISIQDFAAAMTLSPPGGKARQIELETTAPTVPRVRSFGSTFEKSTNYCQTKNNVVIKITNDSDGSSVLGCAQRTLQSGTFYNYDVDYPSCGSSFHCTTTGGSVFVNPACKMYANTTERCSNTSIRHKWKNLDNVVFSCGTGTATCEQGCSGAFTVTCP